LTQIVNLKENFESCDSGGEIKRVVVVQAKNKKLMIFVQAVECRVKCNESCKSFMTKITLIQFQQYLLSMT
jgi:hypothetical protein